MSNEETIEKIRTIIDHIRPWIQGDGGDLEFISYENNIVTIKLTGACIGCAAIDTTLNDGIKSWIMDEVLEVKDVVLQQDAPDFSAFENYDFSNF